MAWRHARQSDGERVRNGRVRTRTVAVLAAAALLMVAAGGGAAYALAGQGGSSIVPTVRNLVLSVRERGSESRQGQESQQSTWTTRADALKSPLDFNGNGTDDYADIVAGARADAEALPAYDDGYYAGGYPPADRGACTDLVWRAFRNAGYDLKAMVDADVAANPKAYAAVASKPDPNIDFRRTGVLDVFFQRYGQSLPTSFGGENAAQWQPGDIVVFEHTRHIAVVSDRVDRATGRPWLLHNMGDANRENDYLGSPGHMAVTGHYRFDASKVPANLLRAWRG